MKSLRLAPVLLLAVLFAVVASLSAAEPAAPAGPVSVAASEAVAPAAPFATAIPAANLCPSFYCRIYYPDDCSCEWIECPNGQIVCGVWYGASAASSSSAVPPLSFRSPIQAVKP